VADAHNHITKQWPGEYGMHLVFLSQADPENEFGGSQPWGATGGAGGGGIDP